MIKQSDFRKFKARYHRNGVTGEAFFLCEFVYLRGVNAVNMRATVFAQKGCVAVTSDDINERWCGDDFENALRCAIEAVEQAQPDSLYARD
jgi:hypothetical protein